MINPLSLQGHLNSISGMGQLHSAELPIPRPAAEAAAAPGAPSFGDMLAGELGKLNETMLLSDQAVSDLATGQSQDVHGTIISVQKADLEFKMFLEVRQKVLDAYQEVMRMQA